MKPAYKITFDDKDITAKIAGRLVQISVVDEAGVKSDRVELVLDDRDGNLAVPKTKAKMEVWIGYTDLLIKKGEYVVEEVEFSGPLRTMTVRANATGASKGAGAAKDKSWNDTTLGDIAKTIAADHNWTPAISAEVASIEIEHADQTENDLQFLSRLAIENGAVVKITHNRLVMAIQAKGKTISGKTPKRATIDASQVGEWSMVEAERGNYDGVKAAYHDKELGVRGEAISGTDGANTHTMPHIYATKANAERAAKAKLKTLQRGKSTFTISEMPGNPEIEAENIIIAKNFRSNIDGEWAAVTVRHTISDHYSMSIECESPDALAEKLQEQAAADNSLGE